jgi:hypothetical protein
MAKSKNLAWMLAASLVTATPSMAQDPWGPRGYDYWHGGNARETYGHGGFHPDSRCPSGYSFLGRCASSVRGFRPIAPPNAGGYKCVPDPNGAERVYGQQQNCGWVFQPR